MVQNLLILMWKVDDIFSRAASFDYLT